MKISQPILDSIGTPILLSFFIILFLLEFKFELRKRKVDRMQRYVTNVSLAAFSLLALRLALIPGIVWIAEYSNSHDIGIFNLFPLSYWLEFILVFLLLDYGNYLWHLMNHHNSFLWRFHNVHHADIDLDVTTAIRFHFVEVLFSVLSRGLIILLLGATVEEVLIYEIVFEAATNFHHSNLKIPSKIERGLNLLIVTPRMHGVHHSIIKEETDSNFSVIFSIWDRIHRTARLNVPQEQITIGAPGYENLSEQNPLFFILLPFKKQRK